MLPYFDNICSIELSERLYRENLDRFRDDEKVMIIQGDSANALPGVLSVLERPALLWLDGHYSAGETARGRCDTPIREEVAAVSRSSIPGHVILIDDARLFGSEPNYPTIAELERLVRHRLPGYSFAVKADVIRVTPNR